MKGSHSAAVVGVGHSRVMRYDDVPLGILALESCRSAVEDAGLRLSSIDGVACVPMQPFDSEGAAYDGSQFVSSDFVIEGLSLEIRWAVNLEGLVSSSLIEAINAVEAGACNYALVFKALHSPRGSYGLTNSVAAYGQAQFEAPYGMFTPGVWAQMWHRYQDRYGSGSREQMAALVTQARSNGLLWDSSYWRQFNPVPLSKDEYLNARMVSTPVSIYDCDLPIQGCGAFVVTTADRAKDLRHPPAYVRGVAAPKVASPSSLEPRFLLEREQGIGKALAAELWRDSGLVLEDINIANLYDGFSIITMLWLEAFGFCGEGEAFEFIQGGRIALKGALPLNTAGGNLGAGRMHGIPQLMDSILQVTGRSGPRQVAAADLALATVGAQSGGAAILFGGHPA